MRAISSSGVSSRKVPRLGQFDQHRQVGAVEDAPVAGHAGPQRQVRRRAAEHVGHDHHAGAAIDLVGGAADLVLLLAAVVVVLDGDRPDPGLLADHMFDRREVFARQSAMCDDDDPDHASVQAHVNSSRHLRRPAPHAPIPCDS
jgi:hypothetical protein